MRLQVAQETEKYFEKVSEMLEKIGRTLPLFRDYQNLFRNHERLLQVLSEAYLNVLRFCTDVTALFKEAKKRACKPNYSGAYLANANEWCQFR